MSYTEQQLRTEDLGRPEPPEATLECLESMGHARNGFCEKCWGDAYMRALADPSRLQVEHYFDALAEIEVEASR